MAKADFIERRDGDLDGQEEVFITNLPTYAAALGIDPLEVTSVVFFPLLLSPA